MGWFGCSLWGLVIQLRKEVVKFEMNWFYTNQKKKAQEKAHGHRFLKNYDDGNKLVTWNSLPFNLAPISLYEQIIYLFRERVFSVASAWNRIRIIIFMNYKSCINKLKLVVRTIMGKDKFRKYTFCLRKSCIIECYCSKRETFVPCKDIKSS